MFLGQQDTGPLFEFTLEPLMEDSGVPLAIMGILVVFSALIMVVVFITLLPRVMARLGDKDPDSAIATAPSAGEEVLPEELVVVIAAAVAEVMGKPHRIVKIRGFSPAELGWSLEGRTDQHHSHRVQH
jgi:sodium pump decarboxylase gamma subunit